MALFILAEQNLVECQIHVIVATAHLQFLDEASVSQCVQVFGSSEPRHIQVTLQKFELGMNAATPLSSARLQLELVSFLRMAEASNLAGDRDSRDRRDVMHL